LRRRIVVVGLVVLSLALLTFSYRSNALDPVESTSASVLRPFEIAANRVARPFRDAANWTHGVFNAKSENKRLEAENARLRQLNARLQNAFEENAILHRDLRYVSGPTFPKGFDEVGARVLSSPSALDQSVTISAGRNQGIQPEDIVLTNEGLVGTVSKVLGSESRVTLITDPTSAVRAVDAQNLSAVGILEHGTGPTSLVLDNVGKDKPEVGSGDMIMTAGSAPGPLQSLFPRNIPIGYVSSVSQTDTDIFQNIQVQPFVDLSSLESVLVLIPKKRTAATHK
jgi:rod shape-determining protein MreC